MFSSWWEKCEVRPLVSITALSFLQRFDGLVTGRASSLALHGFWKQFSLAATSGISALEVFLRDALYKSTFYLLYLLAGKNTCFTISIGSLPFTHTQPFDGCLYFVRENPGEPVPEETFTHSHLSWSSITPYLLSPSIMIRGILLSVQFMCITVFSTISLQVFFGLPLGLAPSTSYSIHFFTQSFILHSKWLRHCLWWSVHWSSVWEVLYTSHSDQSAGWFIVMSSSFLSIVRSVIDPPISASVPFHIIFMWHVPSVLDTVGWAAGRASGL